MPGYSVSLRDLVYIRGSNYSFNEKLVIYKNVTVFETVEINQLDEVIEFNLNNCYKTLTKLVECYPNTPVLLVEELHSQKFNRNLISQLIPRIYHINKAQRPIIEFVNHHKHVGVARVIDFGASATLVSSTVKHILSLTTVPYSRVKSVACFGKNVHKSIATLIEDITPLIKSVS